MAFKKKPDWNAIRAEYIAGGISQRGLAEKYGISYPTIRKRAETGGWVKDREKAERKSVAKATQKTADAAAENAVKLERARALLIDKIVKTLERMPDKSGTRARQTHTDKATGDQLTIDYDLTTLVSAFEKLSNGRTADMERQKRFAEENNSTLLTYADLFARPAPQRTIESIEEAGGENVQN